MVRRKKKKKSKIKVIFIILLIIIIIGGISVFMLLNNKKNNNADNKEKIQTEEKQEQNVNSNLEKAPNNTQEFANLSDGKYITDKGYTLTIKDGVSYIDGYLIVNKTYKLPDNYQPNDPYQAVTGDWCINCINKEVMEAFNTMQSDAASVGLTNLYNNYVTRDGQVAADTYSARPGHSEHQTGLCFDLNSVDDSFANTEEGKWVNTNAPLYGFIIRYPKGKENETGYQYESWHLRYVGKELASKLYNNGDWITMEDYFGLSSSY